MRTIDVALSADMNDRVSDNIHRYLAFIFVYIGYLSSIIFKTSYSGVDPVCYERGNTKHFIYTHFLLEKTNIRTYLGVSIIQMKGSCLGHVTILIGFC